MANRPSVKYRALTFAVLCCVAPVLLESHPVSAAETETTETTESTETIATETDTAQLRRELKEARAEIERLTAATEIYRVQFAAAKKQTPVDRLAVECAGKSARRWRS